jgi:hypothetical protein
MVRAGKPIAFGYNKHFLRCLIFTGSGWFTSFSSGKRGGKYIMSILLILSNKPIMN